MTQKEVALTNSDQNHSIFYQAFFCLQSRFQPLYLFFKPKNLPLQLLPVSLSSGDPVLDQEPLVKIPVRCLPPSSTCKT